MTSFLRFLRPYVLPAVAFALALVSVGCESSGDPYDDPCGDLPPLYPFEYDNELSAAATADSVLLMIGGDIAYVPYGSETSVFVSTRVSPDDSLRLNMHVIGEMHTRQVVGVEPGGIDHQWSGDTLQVWFGLVLPSPWSVETSVSKCSPIPPWLNPERIDVTIPEGVGFRFVHKRVRWSDWK